MAREIRNIGASVRARLLRVSKEKGQSYQFVLIRYANERFLYRLAESTHSARFVLKGAVLLMTWFEEPFRGTRDVDLLGHGNPDPAAVLDMFKEIFAQDVSDGVCFDTGNVRIARIREDTEYGGLRIKTTADIGGARVAVSIDVGFGDAMEPAPQMLQLPGLLDMPVATLRGYARETVIAEKFQAMVALGLSNTRLKDYYDIWHLRQSFEFDENQLGRAIAATFARRNTTVPREIPDALTATFGEDDARQRQWAVFIRNVSLDPGPLPEVIKAIAEFLMPATAIATEKIRTPEGDRFWNSLE